jgi:hypothetical protein
LSVLRSSLCDVRAHRCKGPYKNEKANDDRETLITKSLHG